MQNNRRKTREVVIGNIGVGKNNPIRIQSMTTTKTQDIEKTISQIIDLKDKGCDFVRVTVQGKKEAYACESIKNTLIKKGYSIPIVADIHFYPKAALIVADFVDKIRINPGNFVDKRASFQKFDYDEISFENDLETAFFPLIDKCKILNRAMRLGVNHGSLSDRIMTKYGNTPKGMVVSAIEYAKVCRKYDYHNFLFSMKSSNPIIMIEAYRLLVDEMKKLGWDYPLHLGVTEAGEGEDGRIKSAIGIGSLLLDGIGDTIRVSLTENPVNEIDPARRLIALANSYQHQFIKISKKAFFSKAIVIVEEDNQIKLSEEDMFISSKNLLKNFNSFLPIHSLNEDIKEKAFALVVEDNNWDKILSLKILPKFILFKPKSSKVTQTRKFYEWMEDRGLKNISVILSFDYSNLSFRDLIIHSSSEIGSLLCDGLGDGIYLISPCSSKQKYNLSLNILQAARLRFSKTEFISCPGCGRTLFNIQEVSKRIRKKTKNLKGVKIAIMGCIVNGPGEMADADFGYVGSKNEKVDLYVKNKCVEKNIDQAIADEKLIELIKSEGKWKAIK